jgi:hypothetical protein
MAVRLVTCSLGYSPRSVKHSIRKVLPPAMNVVPLDVGQERPVDDAAAVLVVEVTVDVVATVVVMVKVLTLMLAAELAVAVEVLLRRAVVDVTEVLATVLGLEEAAPATSRAPHTPLGTCNCIRYVDTCLLII